jgi:hypothetical protein
MNCKHATQLMSQAQDRPLTRRERMALKLHLMICKGCNNYNKHLDFIRKAIRQLGTHK